MFGTQAKLTRTATLWYALVLVAAIAVIDRIEPSVSLGMLYVFPIDGRFSQEAVTDLDWLAALSGEEYYPFITFVTTRWDRLVHDDTKEDDLELGKSTVQNLVEKKWARFIAKGAHVYHHGKKDNGVGEEDGILKIGKHKDERSCLARAMISRYYGERDILNRKLSESSDKTRI